MIEEQFLQIDTVKRQNEGQVVRKLDAARVPGHHKSYKNYGITRKYKQELTVVAGTRDNKIEIDQADL